MIKIIAVASDKGGPGKTTLSKHLGKGLHDSGLNVTIYDCDQSNNIINFLIRREEELGTENVDFPEVKLFPLKLKGDPLSYLLRDSPSADVIIIDMVGKLSMLHAAVMSSAHLVIVPTQMDIESVEGAVATFEFIGERVNIDEDTGLPIAVLARLNWDKTAPAVRKLNKDQDFIDLLKLDCVTTPRQQKYVNSSSIGLTVFDSVKKDKSYDKAAFENRMLTKEVSKMLDQIGSIIEESSNG